MEKNNETIKIIAALAIGAIAGAALGILFAPEKGSKTRSNLLGGAKDLAEDLSNKISEEVKALRSKAQELEELAKDKFSKITEDVIHKVDALRSKVSA